MYRDHEPTFKIEKSIGKPLWKYMDFWKFLNLLETSCLYFSNAENLGDNYEGRIPKEVQELMLEEDKRNNTQFNAWIIQEIETKLRKETLISSWTYNEKECFSMWKMYAKDKMGIAIKTNLDSLKKSFHKTEREINIGEIEYFNPESFRYSMRNLYIAFLVKLGFYSTENEIRCITSCSSDEVAECKLVEVDLNELIHNIYISPNSKPEFKKLLELLKKQYNLRFQIVMSEVNDTWL